MKAPGEDEVEAGKPFCRTFRNMAPRKILKGAGIDPETVRFENICEFRPWRINNAGLRIYCDDFEAIPDGSGLSKVGLTLDFHWWVDNLRQRLGALPNLKACCVCWSLGVPGTLERNDISNKHRGSVFECTLPDGERRIPLICTVHPAFILRGNFPTHI